MLDYLCRLIIKVVLLILQNHINQQTWDKSVMIEHKFIFKLAVLYQVRIVPIW